MEPDAPAVLIANVGPNVVAVLNVVVVVTAAAVNSNLITKTLLLRPYYYDVVDDVVDNVFANKKYKYKQKIKM